MTEVLPLSEVKSHLSELVGRVHNEHERITVTVHGRPFAVLMAIEDLESLEETLEILADPDTMRQIAESEAEIARGEVESEADLLAAMERRRRSGR
jgi:prevent-host-death family protein